MDWGFKLGPNKTQTVCIDINSVIFSYLSLIPYKHLFTCSLPESPIWPGTQQKVLLRFCLCKSCSSTRMEIIMGWSDPYFEYNQVPERKDVESAKMKEFCCLVPSKYWSAENHARASAVQMDLCPIMRSPLWLCLVAISDIQLSTFLSVLWSMKRKMVSYPTQLGVSLSSF